MSTHFFCLGVERGVPTNARPCIVQPCTGPNGRPCLVLQAIWIHEDGSALAWTHLTSGGTPPSCRHHHSGDLYEGEPRPLPCQRPGLPLRRSRLLVPHR